MTIVCGTDFSGRAIEATNVAAALAKRRNEPLLLMHVVRPTPSDPVDNFSQILCEAAKRSLDAAAAEIRERGVQVETLTATGWEHRELIAHAPENTSLFVVGGRGDGDGHWIVGSVAERLARTAPHPILVVHRSRELLHWLNGDGPLEVIVTTDLTPASDFALAESGMLRDLGECNVELAYVHYPPFEHERLGITGPIHRRADPLVQEILDRELTKRAASAPFDNVHTETAVTFGVTSAAVLSVAERHHAGLVVIGTHQRRGVERLWHESIAHGVLHTARTNVLCIPFHAAGEEERALDFPKVRRIVAATDLTPRGNRAVAWAIAAAEPGADVTILHVARDTSAELTARLQNLSSPTWPSDIHVDFQVTTGGSVASAIATAAERGGADLIVIGRRSHTRLTPLVGSTVEELLARTDRTVLVAADDAA